MKEKNTTILTIVAIVTLLVAVIGSAYAYFKSTHDSNKSQKVKLTTKTVDSTTFNAGSKIEFEVNQDDFKKSGGVAYKEGTNTAIVTFRSRNDKSSSSNYKICLNITSNDFVSTGVSNELVLNVTRNNETIMSNYNLIGKNNQEICFPTSNGGSSTTQTINAGANITTQDVWKTTVRFTNSTTIDQNENTNKTFNATINLKNA